MLDIASQNVDAGSVAIFRSLDVFPALLNGKSRSEALSETFSQLYHSMSIALPNIKDMPKHSRKVRL